MLSALRQDNSPFNDQQITALQNGLGQIDDTQAVWLSGYLAGKLATQIDAGLASAAFASSSFELKIFYGSQTGNGEQIALDLAQSAEQAGITASPQSLNDLRPAALKKTDYAVFIISTHGEGDPPDDALDLFEFLERPNAPKLGGLQFRVLALGDSTYSQFCEAGRKLEALLLARGASTFAERLEVDLDYEEPAQLWSAEVIEFGRSQLESDETGPDNNVQGHASGFLSVVPATSTSVWKRNNPFQATVQQVQKITGLESTKDVYHIELSLEDSGLTYQPGDSLGVWANNAPELVSDVLTGLSIEADEVVISDGESLTIEALLRTGKELTRLSPDHVDRYAALTDGQVLQQLIGDLNDAQKQEFIEQRQFIDLVEEFPAPISAQELADLLRPLTPRSYSIASSQSVVDDEVHLTVATLHSNALGTERSGVASLALNHRLQPGDQVGVFPEPNRRFRLPENSAAPLILISAGTGIAPYRAFLQQLEEEGSSREVWMIFGNPNLRTDFLYQREWLGWRSSGLLTRIDCAFSRDQDEKHYVQHVVSEHAEELNRWLDRGAHVYICGAIAMGHSVEHSLQTAIAEQRGLEFDAAKDVLADLRRERRLLKDLY